jgi:hypothetical protein
MFLNAAQENFHFFWASGFSFFGLSGKISILY